MFYIYWFVDLWMSIIVACLHVLIYHLFYHVHWSHMSNNQLIFVILLDLTNKIGTFGMVIHLKEVRMPQVQLKILSFCVNLLSWHYVITVYQVKNKKALQDSILSNRLNMIHVLESQIQLEQLNIYLYWIVMGKTN